MLALRLLLWLALAQSLGIVLADVGWMPPAAAFCVGVVALCWGVASGRRPGARALAASALVLCSGAQSLGLQRAEAARGRPDSARLRSVEAEVAEVSRGSGWTRVVLESLRALDGGAPPPRRVRVATEPDATDAPALDDAPPGARVRARLRVRAPRGLRNPGAREDAVALIRAGIGAVARLEKPGLHARIPGRDPRGFGAGLHALRARIGDRLGEQGRGGALLRALALGDRSGLAPSLAEAVAGLGLSHLLAVSGLHLALVAGLVFGGVRAVLARIPALAARRDVRGAALAAALVAATTYAGLAGWGVPVRRALVLLLALSLGVVFGRAGRRFEPLAAASLAILAFEPHALFLPGAQLSFVASAALLASLVRPGAERTPTGPMSWLLDATRASATAIAATAPLAAWHLGRVAPFGLLANLIAVPWTALVLLPASLLAAGAAALPGLPGAGAALQASAWLASLSLTCVERMALLVPSVPPRPPPATGWWLGCVLLAIATVLSRSTAARVIGALLLGGALSIAPPAQIDPAPPRLIFFDVGQGDAALVQAGGSDGPGASVLIDAGSAIPGGVDLGLHAVLPALRALAVTRLDLVVASHGDLDHRGGLPAILDALPVGQLWLPFGARADRGFEALLATAASRRVPVFERGAGAAALDLPGLRVIPLWPPPGEASGSRNDRSLVIAIEVAGRRILLPGDLEAPGEAALLARGFDLRADVLKLAHHGSRSSSTAAFLDAVDPWLAVASAPQGGRFGMPHPEVLARTRRRSLPLWWTGRDGAVMIGLDGNPVVWGYGEPE